MNSSTPHLSEEEIALYLESGLEDKGRRRIAAHLSQCDRCRLFFADSARIAGLWDTDTSIFDASDELISEGLRIREKTPSNIPRYRVAGGASSATKRLKNKGRVRYGFAVAGLVALVGLTLRFGVFERIHPPALSVKLTEPVQAAIERASSNGRFVLPGGEEHLTPVPSQYRSGFVESNTLLVASLERLLELYERGNPSGEAAYWLVSGYLATGQLNAARDYAMEAYDLFGDNSDIAILYALALFLDGDLSRAEEILEKVIEREPDNAVALLDLGIMLQAGGDYLRSERYLMHVRNRWDGTPLGRRAEKLLESIQIE
jgi:hypothetical protein